MNLFQSKVGQQKTFQLSYINDITFETISKLLKAITGNNYFAQKVQRNVSNDITEHTKTLVPMIGQILFLV